MYNKQVINQVSMLATYIYMYVYMYMYMYMYTVYIYIHTHLIRWAPLMILYLDVHWHFLGHQSCLMTPEGRSNVVKPCKTNAINHTIPWLRGHTCFFPRCYGYTQFFTNLYWGRLDWHGIYHIECHNLIKPPSLDDIMGYVMGIIHAQWDTMGIYPLVNVYKKLWKITMFHG